MKTNFLKITSELLTNGYLLSLVYNENLNVTQKNQINTCK